jgi:hypothetical protein
LNKTGYWPRTRRCKAIGIDKEKEKEEEEEEEEELPKMSV